MSLRVDRKLDDESDPPVPLSERWAIFSAEAWGADTSGRRR